jgi:hypothetical protein
VRRRSAAATACASRSPALVGAEQVQVEAARQQRIAQVDGAQQDRGVAAAARRVGRGEQQVARRLQALGQGQLVADPGRHRALVVARAAALDDVGARVHQPRGRAQGLDERQAPVRRLQQRRRQHAQPM